VNRRKFAPRTVLAARVIPTDKRVTGRVSKIDDFRLYDELRPGVFVPHGTLARDRDARPLPMLEAFVVCGLPADPVQGSWPTLAEATSSLALLGATVSKENVA
jgi:hypothetical protein